MRAKEPLPLYHSWPLFESKKRFDLGAVIDPALEMPVELEMFNKYGEALADLGVGLWDCELIDNRLTWTKGVYRLFGLPVGTVVNRNEAIAFYTDDSCAAMERLRAHSIKHRRGFTLDVEIKPAGALPRWMRLIAAPICIDGQVHRLRGYKIAL